MVTGHHPDIVTYVSPDEVPPKDENTALAVGLIGRTKRAQDATDLTVIHVEDKRT